MLAREASSWATPETASADQAPGYALRYAAIVLLVGILSASPGPAGVSLDLALDTDSLLIASDRVYDQLGAAASTCDVDGDGLSDLLLSAAQSDGIGDSRPAAGEVLLFRGRRGAWRGPLSSTTDPDTVIVGQEINDTYGEGLACGDINGDGFDDIIGGAPYSYSLGNSRPRAGELYVIFGRAALEPTIDLLTSSDVTIFGSVQDWYLGERRTLAVGDFNGDGVDDLAAGLGRAPPKIGGFAAGRVYIFWGKPTWPATLDAENDANVVIYAGRWLDGLGKILAAGDLNRDGTAELIVSAPSADGPGESRDGTGEVYIFRGKAVWPAEIDLAVQSSDSILYGVDPFDEWGTPRNLAIGDMDGDGSMEVIVGAGKADGPSNARSASGEGRSGEFGAPLPATVDLKTSSRTTFYGDDIDDVFCSGTFVGDVNGDGLSDFVCDSGRGDGVLENRFDSGEIRVVYGSPVEPRVVDARLDQQDLAVFGAQSNDTLFASGVCDLNADGIGEIVAGTRVDSVSVPSTVLLISPFDVDGDGHAQLPDNCPLVANPLQEDVDVNGVGDACQGDYDGDGRADTLDCDSTDALAGRPFAVQGVAFAPGSKTRIEWSIERLADLYDVVRGSTATLSIGDYGACANGFDANRSDTRFEDPQTPALGDSYTYLVRGVDTACAQSGSWGTISSGVERVNANPAACP